MQKEMITAKASFIAIFTSKDVSVDINEDELTHYWPTGADEWGIIYLCT